MSVFPDQFNLWVINVLVHTTVLIALLLLIALLFRRRAAMRYWILCCGLLLVLGSPAISALIQSRGNSWLVLAVPVDAVKVEIAATAPIVNQDKLISSRDERSATLRPTMSLDSELESRNANARLVEFSDRAAESDSVDLSIAVSELTAEPITKSSRLMQWLGSGVAFAVLIWTVGAVVLLLRMLVGWLRLSRILKRAEPIEAPGFQAAFARACAVVGCNGRRTPRLVSSAEVSGPMAAGIFGGSVVLPKRLIARTDPIALADVLIHEVAHVVRRDQVVVLVQNLVSALYWPHPLVRKLNRELAIAREEVCDNFVLASTNAPLYSRTLLSLAQLVQRPETMPGSVGLFASRWKLEQRVAGLLDETRDRATLLGKFGWLMVGVSTLGLASIMCLGTITVATAQSDSESLAELSPATKEILVHGVVLKPDGSPAAGATVRAAAPVYADMRGVLGANYESTMKEVVSDRKGQFEISIDTEPYGDMPVAGTVWEDFWKRTQIAASMPGFAGQSLDFADIEGTETVTLQLVEDEPIHGSVIDLEGRRRAGVTIALIDILVAKDENLDGWLKAVANGEAVWTAAKHVPKQIDPRLIGVSETVTTDVDGNFTISSVGRERRVRFHAYGNGIAFENFQVATRAMPTLTWEESGRPDSTSMVYGSEFTLTGRPSRTVKGAVTDEQTGEPLAGVDVALEQVAGSNTSGLWLLPTKTDELGRFTLDGMPKGEGNGLLLRPTDDQPYFMREIDVPDPDGIDPISMEVKLHRGVWIEGSVVDSRSREPVSGVRVHYLPFLTNKYASELPEFDSGNVDGPQNRFQTDANGRYRLVGLPGPAIMGFESIHKHYRSGTGIEKLTAPKDEFGQLQTFLNPGQPSSRWPSSVVQIDIDSQTRVVQLDAELDPGDTIRASVFDESNQWLTGGILTSNSSGYDRFITIKDEPVDVVNFAPNEKRVLVVRHERRNLGVVHHITPAEIAAGSVRLTVQQCAKISGRLIHDGKPLTGISITPNVLPGGDISTSLETTTTDENGHFECTLPPGCKYEIRLEGVEGVPFGTRVEKEIEVSSGEALNLGSLELSEDHGFRPIKDSGPATTPTAISEVTLSVKLRFAGRVTDRAGKPLSGVELRRAGGPADNPSLLTGVLVTSDADGVFEFEYEMPSKDDTKLRDALKYLRLVASKNGYGVTAPYAALAEATGQLAPLLTDEERRYMIDNQLGDGPLVMVIPTSNQMVRGRILNADGVAVVGAEVSTITVYEGKTGSLDEWKKETRRSGANFYSARNKLNTVVSGSFVDGPMPTAIPTVLTDSDGYFELPKLGDDRIAELLVSHASIETSLLYVRSEVGQTIELYEDSNGRRADVQTYYPNRFTFVAGATRPVVGRLVDSETGTPVAGIKVEGYRTPTHSTGGSMTPRAVRDVSAEDGSFRLEGFPIGESELRILPPVGSAFLMGGVSITTTPSDKEVNVVVRMRQGLMQRGRIVESETGEPIAGYFEYFPLMENPAIADTPMLKKGDQRMCYKADDQGNFEIPVLPGRGILAFIANDHQRFRRGVGAEAIKWPSYPDFNVVLYQTYPHALFQQDSNYLSPIDLEPSEVPEFMTISLDVGVSIPLKVIGLDGKQVTEAYVSGEQPRGGWGYYPSQSFSVEGYEPKLGRRLMVYHSASESIAVLKMQKEFPEGIELQLVPSGRVMGRLIDADGEPIRDAVINNSSESFNARDDLQSDLLVFPDHIDGKPLLTDLDGRFSIGGLMPGMKYAAAADYRAASINRRIGDVFVAMTVAAGELKDLGDITINRRDQ